MGINWQEIKIFIEVARAGGLSQAAKKTDLSVATLNRKINAFECHFGKPLFIRSQRGYALTKIGQALLKRTEIIASEMKELEAWQQSSNLKQQVCISSGYWTNILIAKNISKIWGYSREMDDIDVLLLSNNQKVDIGKRSADIAIRNGPPINDGLVGKRIGNVAFALYQACNTVDLQNYIGHVNEINTPSARWMRQHYGDKIRLTVNSNDSNLQLIASGVGIGILPCFIGDRDIKLKRHSEVIETLTHEQWLILHHETRHYKPIRLIADNITKLMNKNKKLLSGNI